MKQIIKASALLCLTHALALAQGSYVVNTIAGSLNVGDNGPATQATILGPYGVATDASGNVYISETNQHRIRKVTPSGNITTIAGVGLAGFSGDTALAVNARLFSPAEMVFDKAGNLYFSDMNNQRIRRISTQGIITTIAGTGAFGFAGDGGPAINAQFRTPRGLAIDSNGTLYVSDSQSHRIRKISTSNIISTYAGTGTNGFSGDNSAATLAQLNQPTGLTIDVNGNLFISDSNNYRMRKITPDGLISTYAGTGFFSLDTRENGPASLAPMGYTEGITSDSTGNVYLVDFSYARVRRITPDGLIRTLAGTGQTGFTVDGTPAQLARFRSSRGIAVDPNGAIYIADTDNHRIRRIISGAVDTFAGSATSTGDGGPAKDARLLFPYGVVVDPAGNIIVADTSNHQIRKINADGTITTIAGSGFSGFAGDDGPSGQGQLNFPFAIAADGAGNYYVCDRNNNRIRKISPGGVISTFAGNGLFAFDGDGRLSKNASIASPSGVALDKDGNLYIADTSHHRIRKVAALDGVITTVAGNGNAGFSGDGGPATSAQINFPYGVAIDRSGNLYIADYNNFRIRRVTPGGTISTVAGTGSSALSGDGGQASQAAIGFTGSIAVDQTGNLFLSNAQRIRVVSIDGVINTIAGNNSTVLSGDGGAATSAGMNPWGLTIDATGNILFADQINQRIRKLTPLVPTALAILRGDGQSGTAGTRLPTALAVRLVGTGGVSIAGVRVSFIIISGSATLSTPSIITGIDGSASVSVTLGIAAGPVIVEAAAPGVAPVRFNLTVTAPAGGGGDVTETQPKIAVGGVVGVGGSVPAVTQLSPNGLFSIYGSGFAKDGTLRQVGADDLSGGRLPDRLDNLCVEVGGQRGRVLLITPGQLNVQTPSNLAPGTQPVQIVSNCGQTPEVRSNIEMVTIQAASPEFLYFTRNGNGVNPIAAVNAATGSYIGPVNALPGVALAPAAPGDVLTLYSTGFGATNPAFAAGEFPSGIARTIGTLAVFLGNTELSAEAILYAGVTPGSPGLYQLNIRVPESSPDGNLPMVIRVGNISSPPGAFIAVKRP